MEKNNHIVFTVVSHSLNELYLETIEYDISSSENSFEHGDEIKIQTKFISKTKTDKALLMKETEDPGYVAYNAYHVAQGIRLYPHWADCSENERSTWRVVAAAVLRIK